VRIMMAKKREGRGEVKVAVGVGWYGGSWGEKEEWGRVVRGRGGGIYMRGEIGGACREAFAGR